MIRAKFHAALYGALIVYTAESPTVAGKVIFTPDGLVKDLRKTSKYFVSPFGLA